MAFWYVNDVVVTAIEGITIDEFGKSVTNFRVDMQPKPLPGARVLVRRDPFPNKLATITNRSGGYAGYHAKYDDGSVDFVAIHDLKTISFTKELVHRSKEAGCEWPSG